MPGVYESFPTDVKPLQNATLTWDAQVPEGAGVSVKVRSSVEYTNVFDKPWVGPDGTANTSFTTPGQAWLLCTMATRDSNPGH